LPKAAIDLLIKTRCDVISQYYIAGNAVDLNGDGRPEYQVCCHEFPHGPCESVVIGKIGNEWKLLEHEGIRRFVGACNGFLVLESQHSGFHDICLPNECSSAAPSACLPLILRFDGDRYRPVESTRPMPSE
jgi:hypothetical protein